MTTTTTAPTAPRAVTADSIRDFVARVAPGTPVGDIWSPIHVAAMPVVPAPVAPPVVPEPEPVPTPAATGATEDKRGKGGSYIRPNGEAYYPRKIRVGAIDTTDIEFLRVARANGMNVFLRSFPGTGKTAAIETAFAGDFEKIVVTASTEEHHLVGSFVPAPAGDGTYVWSDGPLLRAAANGRVLFADEIALGDPRELSALYAAMDGSGEITVAANPARGTVKIAPGFVVVAATNPNVPGAIMSEALISRFDQVADWLPDYTIAKKLGCNAGLISVAKAFQKRIDQNTGWWTLSMRDLIKARNTERVWDLQAAVDVIVAKAPEEVRPDLTAMITDACGVTPALMVIR